MTNKKISKSSDAATAPQRIHYAVTFQETIVGNVGSRMVAVGMYGKHAATSASTERHRTAYTLGDATAVADWLNARGVFYDNKGARLYEAVKS